METGDQRPFDFRGVDYRYFLLPVTLDSAETKTITLRIRSSGALLVFSAFNLLLFLSSGTIYYCYNAFYMAAMGLSVPVSRPCIGPTQ